MSITDMTQCTPDKTDNKCAPGRKDISEDELARRIATCGNTHIEKCLENPICVCGESTDTEFCEWGRECGSFYMLDSTKHKVRVPDTAAGQRTCATLETMCAAGLLGYIACRTAYSGGYDVGEAYWHGDYHGPTNDHSCF